MWSVLNLVIVMMESTELGRQIDMFQKPKTLESMVSIHSYAKVVMWSVLNLVICDVEWH